jgi:uncharacterized repeat protein (TIGR03803 family)
MLFALASCAQAQSFTVLYAFTGSPDGANPVAGLIRDSAGNFYGTTGSGGANNAGTVLKLDASGKESVLYRFTGGEDGSNPMAGLVRDGSGNLYGTTTQNGSAGWGTVFKLSSTGALTVLHAFTGGQRWRNSQGGFDSG